jgi:hypothetical protein
MCPRQSPRPSTSSGAAFAEEKLVDRLTRFAGILKVCCSDGAGADIPRAVKVLDKLTQVRLTLVVFGAQRAILIKSICHR